MKRVELESKSYVYIVDTWLSSRIGLQSTYIRLYIPYTVAAVSPLDYENKSPTGY